MVNNETVNVFDSNDEIIITSVSSAGNRLYLTGSRKEKNYEVILFVTDDYLNIILEKQFGNKKSDYEGHDMAVLNDGLLICGCSEGEATEEGGQKFKAYLLKTSLIGENEWEQSIRLLGNEYASKVISNNNIFLFGEANNDAGRSQLFLICLDQKGNVLWRKFYGEGEEIISGGIIAAEDALIISGSIKNEDVWHMHLFKLDMSGEVLWEKKFSDIHIFEMSKVNDGMLLAGSKSGHIILMKFGFAGNKSWESVFDEGTGVSIAVMKDYIFLGGSLEIEGRSQPVLYKIDMRGQLVERMVFEKEGWIEALSEFQGSLILIRHGTYPKEHSELIQINVA